MSRQIDSACAGLLATSIEPQLILGRLPDMIDDDYLIGELASHIAKSGQVTEKMLEEFYVCCQNLHD